MTNLRYYSIDGTDKIVRIRKACPECGPGFFMAKHVDRYYWFAILICYNNFNYD